VLRSLLEAFIFLQTQTLATYILFTKKHLINLIYVWPATLLYLRTCDHVLCATSIPRHSVRRVVSPHFKTILFTNKYGRTTSLMATLVRHGHW